MLNQQDKMHFKKKKEKWPNEPFPGPSEVCVCVRLPLAQPPVRRSVAFPFIVFVSRVHDASAHPHNFRVTRRAGGARGAPERLLANQGSSLTTQGF